MKRHDRGAQRSITLTSFLRPSSATTMTTQEDTTPSDLLALPSPANPSESGNTALDVTTGSSVTLGELGPMVVNSDGTLSRIANWQHMSDIEQQRVKRVLIARNKIRLENEVAKLQVSSATQSDGNAAGADMARN